MYKKAIKTRYAWKTVGKCKVEKKALKCDD